MAGRERGGWTDHEVEQVISKLLLAGVSTAALIVFAGGVLYLVRHGHEVPHYGVFRGEPEELRTIGGVLHTARELSARAIIQLGLGLLIATPVARVAFSLFAFFRQRDATYVVVTGIVLATLLFALFYGEATSPV
jgi:uncharacterized membrane protein